MRRSFLTLAVLGLLAGVLSNDAQACCKKKARCAPVACHQPCPPPPPPCYQPCPPPPPPCVVEAPRKKCFGGLFKKKHRGGACYSGC